MAAEGLAIAGITSQLVGGLVGTGLSSGEANAAADAMDKANQIAMSIGGGPDLAAPIAIKLLQSQGILTPQMEQAINNQASKVAQIQEDPRLREAQKGALQSLQERGRVGLTPEERANLNRIMLGQQQTVQ